MLERPEEFNRHVAGVVEELDRSSAAVQPSAADE
jgi:hypothetical protein